MLEGMTEAERALLVTLHRDATMGRLMNMVLHELRNPLNVITSSAELLTERGDLKSMRDKLLPVMLRSSNAMVASLDAVDQNRIQKELGPPVDLHRTLASCIQVLSSSIRYLEYHPVGVSEEANVDVAPEVLWTVLLSTLEVCLRGDAKNLWVRSEESAGSQVMVIEHDGAIGGEETSLEAKSAGLAIELSRILLSQAEGSALESSPREPQGSRMTLTLRRHLPSSNEQDPLRR